MSSVTQTYGANAAFIEELYERFRANPESVSASWREFFHDYTDGEERVATAAPAVETAAGAAIKHFKGAHGVNVPRSRFLPVKSCSDLLLIKSDIYSLEHGQLIINPSRMFENTPVIKLGDHFKKVSYLAPTKAFLLLGQSLTSFLICADPTVPKAVQEDPEDH